jgi:hypothetical protein
LITNEKISKKRHKKIRKVRKYDSSKGQTLHIKGLQDIDGNEASISKLKK